jgi:hypothetical protein
MDSTHEMPSDAFKAGVLTLFWWMPAVVGVVVLIGKML